MPGADRDRLPGFHHPPVLHAGGTGGGIAYNPGGVREICKRGLEASPTNELLIEESLLGWKEYEMEVVRDKADNCIIVCSIENLDRWASTGDSITVAPAQTLTDKEYQILRNASIAVPREIGVDTGGSNVQFAINPKDGRMIVIEMNPACRAVGAGLEGHRLPDRQGRGQAGGRLHARRTGQTTSPAARRRRPSSRPSTTSSPRCRVSPSRNSRSPTTA